MHDPAQPVSPSGPLATVTPIVGDQRRAGHLARLDARAVRLLVERHGHGWVELPADLGRSAAAAEALLAEAPARFDACAWDTRPLLHRAHLLLFAARETVAVVADEAEVLGDALGADLSDLSMACLLEVAGAVASLSAAPSAPPVWGDPDAARVAEVVVDSVEHDLRSAHHLHRQVYADFTDAVWTIPDELLRRGARQGRLLSRLRLRRRLATVSRTGRVPGRLPVAARSLLAARESRARIASMASLLARHLGPLDRGPMTDLDEVTSALGAVRRLHGALAGQLDVERLRDLLRAEAFRSRELVLPASHLIGVIESWSREVVTHGGQAPLELRVSDLDRWAARLEPLLPALEAGLRAAAAPRSAHALVDLLLLREHLEDLDRTRCTASASHRSVS